MLEQVTILAHSSAIWQKSESQNGGIKNTKQAKLIQDILVMAVLIKDILVMTVLIQDILVMEKITGDFSNVCQSN